MSRWWLPGIAKAGMVFAMRSTRHTHARWDGEIRCLRDFVTIDRSTEYTVAVNLQSAAIENLRGGVLNLLIGLNF